MAKGKILIIDDEKIICTAFERILVKRGYEVDSCFSSETAIEKIKSKKYDIIFVDFILPGIDGIQTCKIIKEISPDSVPVCMTGALDTDPIYKELEFVNAGGKTYYLYKPFLDNEIIQVTEKLFSEREKAD